MSTRVNFRNWEKSTNSMPDSLKVMVYSFSRVAVTKYHRLGGLSIRKLLSHSSGSYKSKTKLCARGWFLLRLREDICSMLLPSSWQFAGNLWHSLVSRSNTFISTFMFTWYSPSVHVCFWIPPFLRTPVQLAYVSLKKGHIVRFWELGLQHRNVGGHRSTHYR